jgi:hypothetical protein
MARRKKPAVSRDDTGQGPILKRPDGYYWEKEDGELRGPFVSRAEAADDRLAGGATEEEFEAGESLQEAESEIGMAEWIDPDTGGPAEDNIPRLEDH